MPPWVESMEQQRRRSTRHPTGSSSSSSNSWSVRSVMYSSDSVRSNNGGSSLSSVAVSSTSTTTTPGFHRLGWVLGLVTLLAVLSGAEAVCDPNRWWNLEKEECDPCTVCGEQQLVLRPCQEYMDTVCGTIGDLDMDMAQLARTEARHEQRHWKEERRKDGTTDGHQHRPLHGQHHGSANGQHPGHPGSARKHENTEEILWDWQAASLLLAIIGCLMFFFAAAIIALNQTRQWKRIEKHFDADMEALSAQLMNHLSSMQQLEDGSIFLDDVLGGGGGGDHPRRFLRGERSVDSVSSTSALLGGHHHHHHHHPIEVRCVYLDQLLDGKNCIQSQGPGNLYIEETNNTNTTSTNVDRGPTSTPTTAACHLPSAANGSASPLNRARLY